MAGTAHIREEPRYEGECLIIQPAAAVFKGFPA
jgi:hypothetical protein